MDRKEGHAVVTCCWERAMYRPTVVQALRVWGIARTVLYVGRLITGMCCRIANTTGDSYRMAPRALCATVAGVVAFLCSGRAGLGAAQLCRHSQLVTGDLLLRVPKL